jgi:hypothetical protein
MGMQSKFIIPVLVLVILAFSFLAATKGHFHNVLHTIQASAHDETF